MTKAYCVGNNLSGITGYIDEMQRRRLISYSDDTNYICKLNKEEISMFLEIMGEFCKISGQSINCKKTKVFFSVMPNSEETDYLTKLGFDNKSFITPGMPLKILGYTFKVGTCLRANASHSLGEISDSLIKRVGSWTIVSKSFEGRKLLTNTLLVSKGNYQLPMMFGLREGDFRVMQKGMKGL